MREDESDSCDGEGRGELRVLAKEQPKQQHSVLNRVARHPNKPNAYNYYQKLVQDFQSLDSELQAATAVQEQLHRKVDYLQVQQQASVKEQLAAQQSQWERERDLEIETIVRKSEEIDSLHAKVDELDAMEFRLLAEIQVLQEKQQVEIRTEAFRIHELVHKKTHLFEAELARGRMDLDFIAQVVKTTHSPQNHEEERKIACNKESIHAIAEEIQQRRRQDFELAAQNLNARLLSFEHEKEALSKKANDIRTRKQRALQILSTNQQQAIKTFFSSAPPKSPDRNMQSTPAPQLDFSSILESLNQSGSQVGQIQSARNEKMSARKTMEEALQEAQATLAMGEKRIEALQKTISIRQKDAEVLYIFPKDSNPNYDGILGIESYPPVKYELVIFIRGVVFEWIDRAVAQAESEPDIQLLKHEIQSWEATHNAVEQEGHIQFRTTYAMSELAAIINEVMHEIATDIHSEFWSSCARVRGTIGSVFREVFFVNAELPGARNSKLPANSTQVKNALLRSSSVLASAMFNHAYEQMRISRKQRAALHCETPRESVQFLHLVAQPKKLVIATKPTIGGEAMQATATQSPKKKWFGFFSSSKQSKNTPTSHSVSRNADSKDYIVGQEQLGNRMRRNAGDVIQLRPGGEEPSNPQSSTKAAVDKKFWQQMLVEIDRVTIPSAFARPSCVEVASDASFCVIGTVSGELLVFDLLHRPPLLLKSHVPPAKSAKSGISRITISANKTQLVIRNQLKVIHVWSVNRVLRNNSSDQQHSSDCFAQDNPQKWKPQPLDLLMELNSDSILQPGLPNDVKQWIPTAKTLTTTLPPQFLCANWFSTTALLGDQTSLVCGHSSGDILKYNIGARGDPNKPKSSIFDAEIAAKFDAPQPSDLMNELSSQDITREFFCGHKHPVLFLKCFQSNKGNPHAKLLSIDSNANVLEWEYDAKHFSGFGWFTPVRQYHLDLVQPLTTNHSNQQGEILQITATVDEKRVVLMVFFEDQAAKKSTTSSSNSPGKLQFHQLLLAGERIQITPARVQLDFAGNSPPPTFALSTCADHVAGHRRELLCADLAAAEERSLAGVQRDFYITARNSDAKAASFATPTAATPIVPGGPLEVELPGVSREAVAAKPPSKESPNELSPPPIIAGLRSGSVRFSHLTLSDTLCPMYETQGVNISRSSGVSTSCKSSLVSMQIFPVPSGAALTLEWRISPNQLTEFESHARNPGLRCIKTANVQLDVSASSGVRVHLGLDQEALGVRNEDATLAVHQNTHVTFAVRGAQQILSCVHDSLGADVSSYLELLGEADERREVGCRHISRGFEAHLDTLIPG